MKLPEPLRGKRLLVVFVAIAVVAAYVAIGRLFPQGHLQQILDDIASALGAWTYLLVGLFAFLETGAFVGLFVPGETVMLIGGAVAGQGAVDVYLLIAVAWFGAWLGDTTSFHVGRRLGRGFVLRHGPRLGISEERFERVEDYFSRHGGKTILIGRFISLVRALAPFVAGSSGMRYRAFVPYSILGTGIWSSEHILIGYVFSRSVDSAAKYAGRGAFLLGSLIVVTVAIVVGFRFLREAENRRRAVEWMEAHRATARLTALGRRLRPQAQFVWDRLTPGGSFGLEFTSVLATLAVGGFVLVAYTVIVGNDPGPTPGDRTAQDIVDSIRTPWLTEIAKGVTLLGSPGVVWPLSLAAAFVLAWNRRWWELGVLAGGMVLIVLGVHAIKDAVDRPRPLGGLVSADGSSFPSAHAAYSTFYVWLAVTTVVRLRPGMARGAAVVSAGIGLAAAIGLSRVYLGVHYMSDVSAGWALGASAFSLCAAIALVVSQLRDNSASVKTPRTEP
ncbi:MAG: bifunctional DedA family/phosphatase PAP2 family protein [Solirubrobacterales bacterium]